MGFTNEYLRYKSSSHFYDPVGSQILYGKYKNKKGIVKEFGTDEKGNPTVIIEPVPKGRKQDKEISLFRIWFQKESS